jgi:RHS repeat-associated protein
VATAAKVQWLWDRRYIDAVVCRWRDDNDDGDFADSGEQLFYCNDANMNVMALVNASGTVVERYIYDPYGKHTIYNADWSATIAWGDSMRNERVFCGYRFALETYLFYVNQRFYNPSLGQWASRDPSGYGQDMTLFVYCFNNPLVFLDPLGLAPPSYPANTFSDVTDDPIFYRSKPPLTVRSLMNPPPPPPPPIYASGGFKFQSGGIGTGGLGSPTTALNPSPPPPDPFAGDGVTDRRHRTARVREGRFSWKLNPNEGHDGWGIRTELSFTPNKDGDCSNCDEIMFVQVVLEWTQNGEFFGAPTNQGRIEFDGLMLDPAKGGWVDSTKQHPYYNATWNQEKKKFEDAVSWTTFKGESVVDTESSNYIGHSFDFNKKTIATARMVDTPSMSTMGNSGHGTSIMKFEACAVCRFWGTVYGCLQFGFTIPEKPAPRTIWRGTGSDGFSRTPSQEFMQATEKWNVYAEVQGGRSKAWFGQKLDITGEP